MAVKAKAVRVVRHVDGSRTFNGLHIPKAWSELPDSHFVPKPTADHVTLASVYGAYNTTHLEVREALIELAHNGEKFSVTGFVKTKTRGRGKIIYISKNIIPTLGNALALRGERKATRGIRGIRAVTAVGNGKMMAGEPIDVVLATANRVLLLNKHMSKAFEDLVDMVKQLKK